MQERQPGTRRTSGKASAAMASSRSRSSGRMRAALATAVGAEPDAATVHGFLASSPCALVLAQADDLAGEEVAVNLPGTDRERPNWRRKICVPVPELLEAPAARAILGRLAPGRVG